tara:strand:- start:1832 stop:2341 length:510 start_codon:yes stop_codon:yes gene_type:complete
VFLSLCCEGEVQETTFTFDEELIVQQKPTPLLGMTAVDDFSSDVDEPNASAGGAMEMQRFFSTMVLADLENCLKNTSTVFKKWYVKHGLIPSQQNQSDNSMMIRIWDADKNGIFEAGYELNTTKSYVRASLDYYQKNGKQLPIETIKIMIERYKLSVLWNDLTEAIACE